MGMGAAVVAGAASAMAGALGLTKAKLNVYKPNVPSAGAPDATVRVSGAPEKSYEFDYNPETLTFKSALETHETGNQAAGGQAVPGAARPATTDFNLLYSIFEVGDLLAPKLQINDLSKLKDELLALTQPHPTTKDVKDKPPHPPLVDFSWGDLITEPAMVTAVEVIYTHMLPTGTPVRMTAKVTLQTVWKPKKGTNPTSGGRTNRRTHTLLAGETLASVAYSEFNDAALWRSIAEENEIDDPMRIRAGAVLLLPSFED